MTGWTAIQRITHPVLFRGLVIAAVFALGMRAGAQETPGLAVEGYITSVHLPAGFDVNRTHVTVTAETRYGRASDKTPSIDSPMRAEVQMGAFVQVIGTKAGDGVHADEVLFRDDPDKKLDGFGEIDTVIRGGAEPVFQADGFRIRVTSATKISYHGDLKSLDDVDTGIWIRYTGKRDKTAEVVATRVEFFAPRKGNAKEARANFAAMRAYQDESGFSKPQLLDADGRLMSLHTKVRYSDAGGYCGWHTVPADLELQQRVRTGGGACGSGVPAPVGIRRSREDSFPVLCSG